jgi:hypothetical protein
MTKTEICRRLHDMVDELHNMPDLMWDGVWPMIRLGFRRVSDDGDALTLVVGVEARDDA